MDVIKRIDTLLQKKNFSDYQLAKTSGLSASTLANIRKRGTIPSLGTLECICNTLHISLAQFFVENTSDQYPVTPHQKEFMDCFVLLPKWQQELLFDLARDMKVK
jgi:transcriptional regulator with XRE-family HTH domain